jgi:hypothetical protein
MTALTGRQDLDATVRIPTARPGEPTFITFGRAELSEATAWTWAALAREKGVDTAVIEQALLQADALARYRPKKLPDASHLTDAEAKQLRYQHQRRAWNGRVEIASPEIQLAEQRGWDAAMARVRAGATV